MDAEAIGGMLASTNALLNFTSGVFLVSGFVFVRRRDVRRHRRSMLGAVTTSALFLVFYLTRLAISGTHTFAGEGVAKVFYLGLLISHMILAALIVPGILRLLYLVSKKRFHDHARLARWVYPAWMYVSITGIVVYVLLYHVFGFV